MRLINIHTLKLVTFHDVEVPAYAILSHVWGEKELDFANWTASTSTYFRNHIEITIESTMFPATQGLSKVMAFCHITKSLNLDYAWVDTCCIDKQNPSELSEAINSMFRYYRDATVCIAYLSDVARGAGGSDPSQRCKVDIGGSRWFTRGWTLQELIAPGKVRFFDAAWGDLGSLEEDQNLLKTISQRTGINEVILRKEAPPSAFSIATRMSWASGRCTTKVEDEAYCLLGLFDVNMPLLYGEGGKAFQRLQEEIMIRSADHSLFAWEPENNQYTHDLLASSPRDFRHVLQNEIVEHYEDVNGWVEPFHMSNVGLVIRLPLLTCTGELPNTFHAVLNCKYRDDAHGPLALLVRSAMGNSLSTGVETTKQHTVECGRIDQITFDGDDLNCECGATHHTRMSVVPEESLLQQGYNKTSLVITREAKVMTSLEMGELLLPNSNPWAVAKNRRVTIAFDCDPDPAAVNVARLECFPDSQWLQRSDVWITQGPCAVALFRGTGMSNFAVCLHNHEECPEISLAIVEPEGHSAQQIWTAVNNARIAHRFTPSSENICIMLGQHCFSVDFTYRCAMDHEFFAFHLTPSPFRAGLSPLLPTSMTKVKQVQDSMAGSRLVATNVSRDTDLVPVGPWGDGPSHRCMLCDATFRFPKEFRRHFLKHETSGKLYECETCDVKMSRKDNFTRHQLRCQSKSLSQGV